MTQRPPLVVSRTDDRIVLMLPEMPDDYRVHAIIGENEAYCASNAIRRMLPSRDAREMVVGSESAGLVVARTDSHSMPIEIVLVDEGGETVVAMTRDDAAIVADMLWGAHRAETSFHAMVSLSGRIVRRENAVEQVVPRPDAGDLADARLLGDISRRARSRRPDGRM
jgi:hypothetical protein